MTSPKEYDELIKHLSPEERNDYLRLVMSHSAKRISDDQFNKEHDRIFNQVKERLRWNNISRSYEDEYDFKLYGGSHSDSDIATYHSNKGE